MARTSTGALIGAIIAAVTFCSGSADAKSKRDDTITVRAQSNARVNLNAAQKLLNQGRPVAAYDRVERAETVFLNAGVARRQLVFTGQALPRNGAIARTYAARMAIRARKFPQARIEIAEAMRGLDFTG
jgi:hypothetical protein